MAEESLRDKYIRLLREGKTKEATEVARKAKGQDSSDSGSEEVEVEEEDSDAEQDAEAHMVYTKLNGVGEELAEEIYQDFGDWDSFVESADKDSLSDISGIGESRAESLLEQIKE